MTPVTWLPMQNDEHIWLEKVGRQTGTHLRETAAVGDKDFG